jgi:acetamidase/formamidase
MIQSYPLLSREGANMLLRIFAAFLLCVSAMSVHSVGQQPDNKGLSGNWLLTSDLYGTAAYERMELKQDGAVVTGMFTGDKITSGEVRGGTLHLVSTSEDGSTSDVNATLEGSVLAGTAVQTDPKDKDHPFKFTFKATRILPVERRSPQRHEFSPTVFYRQFSPANKPVLTIAPGDTVHTTTVDAGGADEKGVNRVLGGNPQTGPFYVEGAWPGDTLVVHILKLRLNRDYAISDDALDERAMNSDLAGTMKDGGKTVRWHLDPATGVATPENPGPNLKNYSVPLKPMLGCVATAVGPTQAAPPTGDSGGYGGNMDFNEIREGTTLYLPVSNPGALLYLGDAHAEQGDGELNGNALETSADVEFSVDVISGTHLGGRRIETPTHIITMGLSASLDEALRGATDAMAKWLNEDYTLAPSDTAQVLGSAAEYKVSEVADRNSGVVMKIDKQRLAGLIKKSKQ